MARTLEILQDGVALLRYECGATLPALQRRQLDALDARLDQGFDLDGEVLGTPAHEQRARFVIGLLLQALWREEMVTARGLCTWLSQREPALRAIHVATRGDELEVELEYGTGEDSDV